ncbi:MAG: hypothetical protein V2A67_03175 [Bacteroidota bacterium]
MDWLDELIQENKEMFANEEPPQGHFERFEERLRHDRRRKRTRMISRISAAAAVGLILMISSILVYERYFDQEPRFMKLGDVDPRLNKVEYYFTSQIEQASIGIDSLSIYSDENTRKMINSELAEMDSIHTELGKKLGKYPGDERIVTAMISYYQTKLKIMQSFLTNLNQIKHNNQLKNKDYEPTLL